MPRMKRDYQNDFLTIPQDSKVDIVGVYGTGNVDVRFTKTGFFVELKMLTPEDWLLNYPLESALIKITQEEWDELADYCDEATIYGQRALYIYDPDLHDIIDLVPERIYDMYDKLSSGDNPDYYFVIGEVEEDEGEWDAE